jgi:hypothetical protein
LTNQDSAERPIFRLALELEGATSPVALLLQLWVVFALRLLTVMGVAERQAVGLAEYIPHYLDSSYTVFLEA